METARKRAKEGMCEEKATVVIQQYIVMFISNVY